MFPEKLSLHNISLKLLWAGFMLLENYFWCSGINKWTCMCACPFWMKKVNGDCKREKSWRFQLRSIYSWSCNSIYKGSFDLQCFKPYFHNWCLSLPSEIKLSHGLGKTYTPATREYVFYVFPITKCWVLYGCYQSCLISSSTSLLWRK